MNKKKKMRHIQGIRGVQEALPEQYRQVLGTLPAGCLGNGGTTATHTLWSLGYLILRVCFLIDSSAVSSVPA